MDNLYIDSFMKIYFDKSCHLNYLPTEPVYSIHLTHCGAYQSQARLRSPSI